MSQIPTVSRTDVEVISDILSTSPDAMTFPEQLYAPTPPSVNLKASPPMPSSIKVVEKPQMLEINPGIWDGLNPDQAKKYYPEDWDRFTKDPYSYRVPRAESYHDLSGEHIHVFSSKIITHQCSKHGNVPLVFLKQCASNPF